MNNKDREAKEVPKAMFLNNFSIVYSLTNDGSQEQGPFISPNTTALNLYNVLPDIALVKGELLARNKSKNGNFTDNLQVDGNDIIEFKLSITNISTTNTLYDVSSRIDISNNLLAYLDIPLTTTMGNVEVNPQKVIFNISRISPKTTAIATYVLVAAYSGNLSFSGYINVWYDSRNNIKKFNFSTLPSISIINAPNLSSVTPIINMKKYQKLIQSGVNYNFSSSPVTVINGDIIEFQLYINNNNSNKTNVYNLKLVDKLNNNLSYIEGSFRGTYIARPSGSNVEYNTIWGSANFNSTNATTVNGKLVGGRIEWTMSVLDNSSVSSSSNANEAYLYFQCEVVR